VIVESVFSEGITGQQACDSPEKWLVLGACAALDAS